MQNLNKQELVELHSHSTEKGKAILEKKYGNGFFSPSSNWIKLWEKFCKENKLKVTLPHANPANPDEEWDNSCVMLRHIFKIRRKDWKPDFRNGNQAKWFPVFKMLDSGFGFAHSFTVSWHSYSSVGSRLCLPTEKMSDDVAKEFLPIFEKFHMNL